MSVDFATLALRVDNTQAVPAFKDTEKASDNLTASVKKGSVTIEQAREAWKRAGGDMAKLGQELLKSQQQTEQAVPPMNRFKDSIDRMRESAAKFGATRFHEQLQKAEAEALRASQGINRLADSMQKMRAAAAQGQANAQAVRIVALDPFQQQAVAAEKAVLNMGKLKGAMQSLAASALSLAPGVAQFSGAIGSMALSTGMMVGVLAGVAALGFAWNKLTEDTRKANEETAKAIGLLEDLRRKKLLGPGGEAGASVDRVRDFALPEAVRSLDALTTSRAGLGARNDSPRALLLDKDIADQKLKIRDMRAFIAAGEEEVTRLKKEALDKQAADRKAAADKEFAEMQERLRLAMAHAATTEWQGGLVDAKNPMGGLQTSTFNSQARANAQGRISDMRVQADMSVHLARFGQSMAASVASAARIAAIIAQVTKEQQQLQAAKGMAINSGLSLLSSHGGAAGGIISAGISGGMQGGGLGIAVGAGSALVDTIFNMGHASREAAMHLRALKDSLDDSILSWKAELGLPGADNALGASRIHAQTQAARDQLDALNPGITGINRGMFSAQARADYQKKLDEINALEKQRIDNLGKEKDAIDKLNASMVNMVQGYKLQSTIFRNANPQGPRANPFGGPRRGGSDNLTVTVEIDGRAVGQAVLTDFKREAAAGNPDVEMFR